MQFYGLNLLDFIIVSGYLLFISWKGFRTASTSSYASTDDFFLANRTLGWPLIGFSLFASNISSSSIIGLASSGYKTGISVFNYEWTGALMLVIFATFIVPYYLKNQLITMPEYLERRFDARSRYYFSVISITANTIIDISGALYASSIVLKGVFPEVDIPFFVLAMALVSGLYTMAGGLRAVVVTDSIQAILLTTGSAIISIALFWKIGSWDQVKAAIDPNFLSLIRPVDDPLVPWPALLISLPILGFYFMCTNQHMVQRVLGARSIEDGRKGAIFAGFLKLPLLFIMVLPGTLARIFYPDLANPNLVFPELMFDLLPVGLLGIVLTGFVAALMSSIDSALTAASSIATMDIYKKLKPSSDERHLVRMGRIFIFLFVLIASAWAPFIDHFPTLWEYLTAALSYLIPPVVTCFLFGLFWRKASSDGAVFALVMGNLLALFLIANNYFIALIEPIHYLYSATLIFIFSSLVMVTTSLIRPDTEHPSLISYPEFRELVKRKKQSSKLKRSSPWYSSYRFYALGLCFVTSILVIMFW